MNRIVVAGSAGVRIDARAKHPAKGTSQRPTAILRKDTANAAIASEAVRISSRIPSENIAETSEKSRKKQMDVPGLSPFA